MNVQAMHFLKERNLANGFLELVMGASEKPMMKT